jgi:predicted RNA-binding protein with TRAM domain
MLRLLVVDDFPKDGKGIALVVQRLFAAEPQNAISRFCPSDVFCSNYVGDRAIIEINSACNFSPFLFKMRKASTKEKPMKNYPVKKNQELEVDILDLSHEGNGIAKVDGYLLFIENTLPGERAHRESLESRQQIRFCQSDETVTSESRSPRVA